MSLQQAHAYLQAMPVVLSDWTKGGYTVAEMHAALAEMQTANGVNEDFASILSALSADCVVVSGTLLKIVRDAFNALLIRQFVREHTVDPDNVHVSTYDIRDGIDIIYPRLIKNDQKQAAVITSEKEAHFPSLYASPLHVHADVAKEVEDFYSEAQVSIIALYEKIVLSAAIEEGETEVLVKRQLRRL